MDRRKILTHAVDLRTAQEFRSTDELNTWLRVHPNFIKQEDGRYSHVYEPDYVQFQKELAEQQERDADTQEDTQDA